MPLPFARIAPSAAFTQLVLSGCPMRLGIMGGTFDPLHNGHLRCAEQAMAQCGLDGVLLMPAGNPSFKQERGLAPAMKRLEWCRLAVADDVRFAVSDIEVLREGVTYTVDTLRVLREACPRNVELCFIMGADSAATLPRWHEAESLPALATYIVVSRPGHGLDAALRDELACAGFSVEYVEDLACDISSSDIRTRVEAGEGIGGLVPEVIRHLVERDPAYHPGVLGPAFFAARAAELAERVSESRLRHVMGVVDACERLARLYGVDERKARLAGLLHDWDKGYDDAGIRARVEELGLSAQLDAWVVSNMPQVLHGHTAACALAREFPSIPADVIQAVDRHTTADLGMQPLDMVVYIADAIEDGRRFGSLDDLRAAAGKVSLEELFFMTYEYWTQLILERRRQLHPDTIRIWNELVARRAVGKDGK